MESIDTLKVGFIPFAAPGHMIPLMDIARIFARQGADVTYFTTPANAIRFQEDVDSDFKAGYKIKLHALPLPCVEVGLPPGLESASECTSMEMFEKLMIAFGMIEKKIEQLLCEMKADCVISDVIHFWTTEAASRLEIPKLSFECAGYIAQSISHCIRCYAPHEKVESDMQPFVLPGLPHKIGITKLEIPFWLSSRDKVVVETLKIMNEAERNSLGVLMNSFHELEADYMKYYESSTGMKSWAIGPVSLWFYEDDVQKQPNGKLEVIQWLDSKQPNSVLYVSFGSMTKFPDTQLLELAHALEDSGHQFIWVVGKRSTSEAAKGEGYLPEGFEERVKRGNKGLIIKSWAPQILILNHPAIGGFITQCGWNSILESVSAGQPIISWPLTAEQFFIEKLVTQVLKIGVAVGSKRWWDMNKPEELEIMDSKQINKAINFLMSGGKEVEGMRERARELGSAAKKATSSGGSSHANLVSLMDELKSIKSQRLSNHINYFHHFQQRVPQS